MESAANAMASLHHVPDLRIVAVTQVRVGETDADQCAKGTEAAGRILSAWTTPS